MKVVGVLLAGAGVLLLCSGLGTAVLLGWAAKRSGMSGAEVGVPVVLIGSGVSLALLGLATIR